MPTVSVIIPCYNLGAHLDEAVSSVLEQSFDDLEILIVDDGSTDEATRTLLDGYQRPRTRVFRTPNRGLGAARNFLVERASGRYLCALDADDRLHPELLARAVPLLEADPGLSFVSAWVEAFGDETWVWRQERCDLEALLAENTVMTAAVVRRQAVLDVGGYDEQMPAQGDEDWDLWLRLVAAGCRGTILPKVLFHYRRRPGSMSLESDHGETHLRLHRYLLAKHRDLYRRHLRGVVLAKDRHIGEMLHTNDRLERDIGRLEREVELRTAELENLRRRLAAARDQGAAPSDEAAALRSSWSWRVTAPLRAACDLLHGRRPRG